MQVSQQILDLLVAQDLSEAGHLAAARDNNLSHSVVIGGQTALPQILVLEHVLESGALLAFRRIGFVATITAGIIDSPASRLLLIQAKFGIALAPLYVTGDKR